MTEEAIRKAHKIDINESEKGFQAQCACRKYRGTWQEYKGVAVQNGRFHVQKEVDKETKKDSKIA
jgi:hypothetical protein